MFGIAKQQFGNPTPNRHECVKQICAVGAWATHEILVLQTRTEHKRGWLFDGQFLDSHPIEHGKSLNPEQITWGAETYEASLNRCFFQFTDTYTLGSFLTTSCRFYWPCVTEKVSHSYCSGHWHVYTALDLVSFPRCSRDIFESTSEWLGDHLTYQLLSNTG